MAQAWYLWHEFCQEARRLRVVTMRVVMRWANGTLAKALEKWYDELVRARKARKAALMWRNHVLARGWRSWCMMVLDRKRLRALASKCIGRWKHRVQAMAWLMWEDSVRAAKRKRALAARAIGRWRNRALAHAWDRWFEQHL